MKHIETGSVRAGPFRIELEFQQTSEGYRVVGKGVEPANVIARLLPGNYIRDMAVRNTYELGTIVSQNEFNEVVN